MSDAVACRLGKYSAREIKVRHCKFDVVAYSKTDRLFRIIECKKSRIPSGIGQAFGQVAAYSAVLTAFGKEFLNAYSKKLDAPMAQRRWIEATDYYRRINVKFYVALTDKACKQIELLRAMKKLLPQVGIIRIKPDGKCRFDLKAENGKKDVAVAEASPVIIRILRNQPSDSE